MHAKPRVLHTASMPAYEAVDRVLMETVCGGAHP